MKPDSKDDDNPSEWHSFLKTLQSDYHQLNLLKRQLDVINDHDWDRPEAEALRKELAHTLTEVLTREAFIEHCRREGKAVPDISRQKGTG